MNWNIAIAAEINASGNMFLIVPALPEIFKPNGTDATTGTIKIPGINAYNVSQSFGIGNSPTPIGPSTSKINPPITDAGINVLCKKPTFARIYVPSNKNILNTPKAYNISANTLEDIKTPPQT